MIVRDGTKLSSRDALWTCLRSVKSLPCLEIGHFALNPTRTLTRNAVSVIYNFFMIRFVWMEAILLEVFFVSLLECKICCNLFT